MSRYRDTRYREIPDIGYLQYRTRYRVQYRDIPISGNHVPISGLARFQMRACGHKEPVTVLCPGRHLAREPGLARPYPTRISGVLPDIGSPTDTISGYVSRYRSLLFKLTRYRDMSHPSPSHDGTRYRVYIGPGTHPISGHHVTEQPVPKAYRK